MEARADLSVDDVRVPTRPQPLEGPATARGLRSSVATSVAGKVAEMATLVVLAVVVPRVLGPVDYGRFAVPLTVVTVGSLAMTLGGHVLMARYVPTAPQGQRGALALAIGVRLARGRAVQLLGVAAVAAGLVVWDASAFPPLVTAVVVVALGLNVAATLALQVGLGLGRTTPWSLRYPVQNTILVVAAVALYQLSGSTGAVVGIAVAGLGAAALGVVVVAPLRGTDRRGVEIPAGALRFGTFQAAGAALVQFSHRGGVLAVALLAGSAAETGHAALAVGIALGATYAVLQTFTVSLPHLTDDRSRASAEAVLRRLTGGALVLLVPGAAGAALLLDPLVPAVFGAGYRDAVAAFGPALALVVVAPVHSLTVQAAALRLRPEATFAGGLASAVVFAVVALAVVPAWGAVGGTSAALAGAAAGAIVSARMLPGAVGSRIAAASLLGAAFVLAVALAA